VNRLHRLLVLVAPALIAGAVIASATIGEAQPTPRPTPTPTPTPHPGRQRHTVVIQGDIDLPQVARDQIRAELDRALAEIDRNADIPAAMRARLHRALAKARGSNMKDLAKLGVALREMSTELEGLGDDLDGQVPAIQAEIDRALRSAGVHGRAGRVVVASGDDDDDPWAGGGDDDDDDADSADDADAEDRDVDIDVDVDVDTSQWMRGWQGVAPTPPVPPVPPVAPLAPLPPMPPMPPAPPGHAHAGVDLPDSFDVGVDLDDVELSNGQARSLRAIAKRVDAETRDADQIIRSKSDELKQLIAGPDVDKAAVNRLVDEITREEAKVRKARLMGLIDARGVLTADGGRGPH